MQAWAGRRVLVTGAGGFIGSHLTERLVTLGATARALIRYTSSGSHGWLEHSKVEPDVEFVAGDVTDREMLRRAMGGVDVVFHLAALIGIPYSYDAPASYVRTNVEGTLAVLQTALDAGVSRVVHTSTSEVYGSALQVPMSEQHPLRTQSPYAATKAAADLLALAFHRSFALPVVTVRPFNTFGPRQSARGVIPTIIAQALARPVIELGHLTPTRDFTYVRDTVEGFVKAAEAEGALGETINLGTGSEISIAELAAVIQTLAGTSVPIVSNTARERPTPSEVDRLCADASRARALLGWQPQWTLTAGLTETIAWMKEHHARYRPDSYSI